MYHMEFIYPGTLVLIATGRYAARHSTISICRPECHHLDVHYGLSLSPGHPLMAR